MKFFIFHVFEGSELSLRENAGGVDSFIKCVINYSKQCKFPITVIGRNKYFIPRIITNKEFKSSSSPISNQTRLFPFFMYILSNFILGLIIFLLISAFSFKQRKDVVNIIHVHNPVIGGALFLFPYYIRTINIVQFHSEYSKRLKLILPKTLLSKLAIWLHSFFEKVCLLRADRIIAINENIFRYLIGIGCSSDKIRKIPIFLDTSYYNMNSAEVEKNKITFGISKEKIVVTYIGRLSKEKNIEVIIRAFSYLDISIRRNLLLLIVGKGDELGRLKSIAASISENLFFLGHRTDIKRILSITDIFIIPSFTEGFPFSLLEAMATGKAIIASNIPAIRKIVDDRKEALLFNPHNPEELRDLLLKLYSNQALRQELGKNARKKSKIYDAHTIIPRLFKVYLEVLHKLPK